MHVVVWQIPATYSDILDGNVHYVRRHYKSNTTIIFDGYDQTTTIKSMKQKRRATTTKSSADIEVMLDATTTTTQSQFLANPYNKAQLIKLLSTAQVVQAEADANVTIAITALENASKNDEECVAVISRDTDVLVILIARLDDRRNIVLMRSLAVIRQAHPSQRGKINYHHLRETAEASGGACTYSARATARLYRKPGRRYSRTCIRCSVIQVIRPRQILQTEADHCPKQDPVISHLRVTTVTNLALLPPTSDAARMHSFRVYLQVQLWYGRDMDPLKWGWEMKAGNLQPIGSERPAAPPRLLKIIFFEFKSGCKEISACSCRRAGQLCTPMCGQCVGVSACCALTLMHQICQNRCLC